jgi:hypothetical protein
VLKLDEPLLQEEPRILNALINGCPDVHTARLHVSWSLDVITRYKLLARLFTEVRWPLRSVFIQDGDLEMVQLLAKFAGTLEEVQLTADDLRNNCNSMLVFPRVAKLQINHWHCYWRTPLVKTFPAVAQLEAFTWFGVSTNRARVMNNMTKRLDLVNAQPCEGWQHLDHVDGNVLIIHALTVPSRVSVRRLRLDADLYYLESATRIRSTVQALRPTMLELSLTCEADVELKRAWDTWAPHAMASVRCLVLKTVFLAGILDDNGRLGVHEFTVR